MAILDFTTSGKMTVSLSGARFGNVLGDPDSDPNVKRFEVHPNRIEIEVHDMSKFSRWGRVQILEEGPLGGHMKVSVDTHSVGWFGSAQINLHHENNQHIVSDNFQSGVGGLPNTGATKVYNVTRFQG